MQVPPSSNVTNAARRSSHPYRYGALVPGERLQIEYLVRSADLEQIDPEEVQIVIRGLTRSPKSLPPRYFYDDRGSQLFEQICELPEYYLTRTETSILKGCAGAIAQLTGPCEIVELGSGSSTKTRILLDAYQDAGLPLCYLPIDVSAGILESSAHNLLNDYPTLQIHALVSTYQLALETLPRLTQSTTLTEASLLSRMICFIGSTLGNLNPEACDDFFSQITAALQPGEYFLLGIDLQKPRSVLEAAYNDSQGVTAAFNLNMLSHLNRRFQGNFDEKQFEHWSFYNETLHQIEMHLRSRIAQTVTLKALDLAVSFQPGETILSEISRKFNLEQIQQELQSKGLTPIQTWTDENQWFGLVLCQLQTLP